MQPLDIVFAGTPEFAARHLDSLLGGPHRLLAVYTQPDRKAGRGKKLLPSPVKVLAQNHGIRVMQPPTLKTVGPGGTAGFKGRFVDSGRLRTNSSRSNS